jgi:hypothetical protein
MAATQEQIKPVANNTPKLKPEHPLAKLCRFKTAIVIQQKGGNVIKGRAKWFRHNFVKLTDAEIIGANKTIKTAWLLVDHNSIAHVHPDPDVSPEQPTATE